jgi:putative thioredoxin
MSDPSPFVVETSASKFTTDVISRSNEVPVVVDFWAPWCGPCRLIGPVLEKLAAEYDGQFVLVKANTEQLPEIAAELGVRSIPAVFGLRDGKIVDTFVGALPESAIRVWLERLLPTPAEKAVAEARRLASTDPDAAEASYRRALELAPDDAAAKVGLARLLLGRDQVDEARALAQSLERRGFLEPEAERLVAELALREQGEAAGDLDAMRSAVAANPDDPALKLKLAEALAARGRYEEALELALERVESGRKDEREEARKLMINIFQLLPDDSDLLGDYRRKLAAALF